MYYKQFIAQFKDTSTDSASINTRSLEEQATKELYEELSDKTIANIIREHYDTIRITESLIESYKDLACSRSFTVDPVVHHLRSINKLDRLVENRLHYVLKDNTTIVITEQLQNILNKLLQNHTDVVDYMRESKENFMYVINKLEEN